MEWISFTLMIFKCHPKRSWLKVYLSGEESLYDWKKWCCFLSSNYFLQIFPDSALGPNGNWFHPPTANRSSWLSAALFINTRPSWWSCFQVIQQSVSRTFSQKCCTLRVPMSQWEIVFIVLGVCLACLLLPTLHFGIGQFHLRLL